MAKNMKDAADMLDIASVQIEDYILLSSELYPDDDEAEYQIGENVGRAIRTAVYLACKKTGYDMKTMLKEISKF